MIKKIIDNKNIRIQRFLLSNFFLTEQEFRFKRKLIQLMLNINREFFPEM